MASAVRIRLMQDAVSAEEPLCRFHPIPFDFLAYNNQGMPLWGQLTRRWK